MVASGANWSMDIPVRHGRLGDGVVLADRGETVLVRFGQDIKECLKGELTCVRTMEDRIAAELWDVPMDVIARVQAEAIVSVNDAWGVYAPSKMELLPHQLWVCRQVTQQRPIRWLVADDVGLGKTVEAGMILSALLTQNALKRILILCPASLVEQWQYRMHTMFGLNFAQYTTDADTSRTNFWRLHNQVIASMQTVRMDQRGRRERLLEAEAWDIVLVDEAHHLNSDEQTGPTLGYRLVRDLQDSQLIHSMVFFSGTPHRGKDHGFIALLHLLRPDLFDPKVTPSTQMHSLSQVMIRNNKSNVTDLQGHRLFQTPLVDTETYHYSPEEEEFYRKLTEFIATGRGYASSLSRTHGQAVMLVLIAMQKLASSSVAAVRRALTGRLERIRSGRIDDAGPLLRHCELSQQWQDQDEENVAAEQLVGRAVSLRLMQEEADAIEDLLDAAARVRGETRILTLIAAIRTRFPDRNILFFTEYKATQALLVTALLAEFGAGCATFINGDERLDNIVLPNGHKTTFTMRREEAAAQFNMGRVRFLVSTEAGGEGIDLQEQCYTLVHVDMPWNPMRMHQRVGRLNRYGQKRRVDVLLVLNPDTVEALIWDKLNEKLKRITTAMGQVMEEPEDMLQLVLGMTSGTFVRDLFATAGSIPMEGLSTWFDHETAQFGGNDILKTVRDLVGNANRFDYQKMASVIPRTDIPDLRPFFETMLAVNGRRLREESGALSFHTPDGWRKVFGIRADYQGLRFERKVISGGDLRTLLGVGHRLMDMALAQARAFDGAVTAIGQEFLHAPLIVLRARDRVTSEETSSQGFVFGVTVPTNGETSVLADWELLRSLNELPVRKTQFGRASRKPVLTAEVEACLDVARQRLTEHLEQADYPLRLPTVEVFAVFYPTSDEMVDAEDPIKTVCVP